MLAVLGDRTAPTLRLRTLQSQSQPEEEDEAEEDEAEELGLQGGLHICIQIHQ